MKDSELTPESVMGFGLVLQLLETLKKMKELLEKLIQQPAAVNYITRNYYAPHMENHGPVTYNAPVVDYSSRTHASSPMAAQDEKRSVPTFKEMMEVFKIVNKAGYWCSNRSWGVGFPCLAEVCYHMKTPQKPACLFVGGALFGTLMTRCYYYFYHRPEEQRRLNYEVFVIEDPASGKSFAGDLYKVILSPIIASDAVGNKAINNFKKESKKREKSIKEQKKDGLVQPEVKVRIHGSRTSNQTFIEDMVNCYEQMPDGNRINLHLFTFDSELENCARLGGSSQAWIDKSVFELKAFHNEEDNQQYKNLDSVSGPFNVYWNFIYTGVPLSLSKKVNIRNFGSGLYSRLAVLPLCANAFEVIPLYRRSKQNLEVIDKLKEWAFKLDQTRGELPIWPLVEHTYYWMADIMKLAELEQDKITAMLVKRVPYYGLNVAAPFIVMRHWEEWQKSGTFKIDEKDKDLCSVILEIQLYTQKKFFGGQAKAYYENKEADEQSNKVNYYSKSDRLLESLPAEFTQEKLIEVANVSVEVARVQIWRWVKDKKVEKSGRGKTAKLKKLVRKT